MWFHLKIKKIKNKTLNKKKIGVLYLDFANAFRVSEMQQMAILEGKIPLEALIPCLLRALYPLSKKSPDFKPPEVGILVWTAASGGK